MPDQPVDYATPQQQDRRRRGLLTWLTLLAVWIVGLGVWTVYVAALIYAFFRIFG